MMHASKTRALSAQEILDYYCLIASYIVIYAHNQILGDQNDNGLPHSYGPCINKESVITYVQQGMYECYAQTTLPTNRVLFVLSGPPTLTNFIKLIHVGRSLKESFDKRLMSSYCMIVGQKLYIIAHTQTLTHEPLALAQEIGLFVIARMHKKATMAWIEPNKQKKIYIDITLNKPQAFSYVPYSLVKGKKTSVALPCSWESLINCKKIATITPSMLMNDQNLFNII